MPNKSRMACPALLAARDFQQAACVAVAVNHMRRNTDDRCGAGTTAIHSAAAETARIEIVWNGEPLTMQHAPLVREGRVYMPLRELSGLIDGAAVW
ncbi:hypothetical protein ABEV74_18125, partial [Paenibacillus cisolokensis]|uniref:hypothetical protein n=1 Tax=Paenibacillus cisolokensis TaxID=1658519 RepID=UPI003D29F76B